MPSASEMLVVVRTAISNVLSGGVSSYRTDGGRSAQMLSLKELRILEAQYAAQAAADSGTGSSFALIRQVRESSGQKASEC